MLKFLKKTVRWYMAVPLSVILAVVSCNTDDLTPSRSNDFTGEEMFKGMFFFQGPVAGHLESLRPHMASMEKTLNKKPGLRTEYEAYVNEIITQIKVLDPQYFTDLKSQFESDNLYGIQLALKNASKMITAAGYRTKYAGMFMLNEELKNKKVDFTSEKLKRLDLTKKADIEKFRAILSSDYSIELPEQKADQSVSDCIVVPPVYVYNPVWVYPGPNYDTLAYYVIYYIGASNFSEGFRANMGKGIANQMLVSEIAEKF